MFHSQSFLGVHLSPVVLELLGFQVRSHSAVSGLPGGWANLAVLLVELEGLSYSFVYLNQSKVLLNISTNSQIVDADVLEDLVVVNNESSSQSDTVLVEHSIALSHLSYISAHLVRVVSKKGILDISNASLALW